MAPSAMKRCLCFLPGGGGTHGATVWVEATSEKMSEFVLFAAAHPEMEKIRSSLRQIASEILGQSTPEERSSDAPPASAAAPPSSSNRPPPAAAPAPVGSQTSAATSSAAAAPAPDGSQTSAATRSAATTTSTRRPSLLAQALRAAPAPMSRPSTKRPAAAALAIPSEPPATKRCRKQVGLATSTTSRTQPLADNAEDIQTGAAMYYIKQPYLDLIFAGQKTFEIRAHQYKAGYKYICLAGQVYGKAYFGKPVEVVSAAQWRDLVPHHRWDRLSKPYKHTWALPITEAIRFVATIPYEHQIGSVGTPKFYPPGYVLPPKEVLKRPAQADQQEANGMEDDEAETRPKERPAAHFCEAMAHASGSEGSGEGGADSEGREWSDVQ